MLVITGATGQLGRLVIENLLKKVPANSIVAAVRNVEKASDLAALGVNVRQADYNDPASWDAALQGAKQVLLISSSEIGQRVQQHLAVIEAAKRAKVELLAYTSVLGADTATLGLAAEHKATEAALLDSGLPVAILRNGWYTENYVLGLEAALAHSAVIGCAEDGKISAASRADYAEAAVAVLTSENQAGKVYELAGDVAFTMQDFAAAVSNHSGKNIPYVNLPQAEYQNALLNAGLPAPFAALLADADACIAKGELFNDSKQLSQLIGRATTSLDEVLIKAI